MHTKLTLKNIKEIFDYDAETGVLRWKIKPGIRAKSGAATGSPGSHGYLQSVFCGKDYLTHRLIFAWFHERWPKDQIDHINGIRADNRIANLREVTHGENHKNQRIYKNNKSGCSGVCWDKRDNKWQAKINVDNKQIYLGLFISLPDAIKARKAAEVKHGFHKNHGSVLAGGNRE